MNVLQQPCPQCGRQLQLPSDALGKMAKCPACGHTFTVSGIPDASGASENVEPASFGSRDAFAGVETTSTNPYASPNQPQEANQAFQHAGVGPAAIVPRAVDYGEIWSEGVAVFKNRWGSFVGGFALILVVSILLSVAANGSAALIAAGDEALAAAIGGLFGFLSQFIGNYFQLGYARACLAAARGQESPVQRNILPPFMSFLRFLGGSLVFGFVVVILVGGVVAAAVLAGQADGSLAAIVGVVGGLFVAGIVIFIGLRYWPFMFVVAEDRYGLMDSIRIAGEVTKPNVLTSFLMLFVGALLAFAGAIACYVGMFVTLKLVYAIISVGYLMMSSQPFAQARVPSAPYQPS
ncbi:MAG: hypothetical protein AAGD07_11805 [Planctomycetota bacterium]